MLEFQFGRWKTDVYIDCPDENDDDACIPFIKIPLSTVIYHDEYKKSSRIINNSAVTFTLNDIAIVKLLWSIRYSYAVKPVCIPTNDSFPLFNEVEVSGFGNN